MSVINTITVYDDYTDFYKKDDTQIKQLKDVIIQRVVSTTRELPGVKGNLSNYHFDYLLIHYASWLHRIFMKEPEKIFTPSFLDFVKWVYRYYTVLTTARDNAEQKSIIPGVSSNDKLYVCSEGHSYNMTFQKDKNGVDPPEDIKSLLEKAVEGGYKQLKYVPVGNWEQARRDFGTVVPSTRYWEDCVNDGTNNFFDDVVRPTELAFLNISAVTPARPNAKFFDTLTAQYNDSIVQIKKMITEDEPTDKYSTIGELLNVISALIQNSLDAANLEVSIIEHTTDINVFYDRLTFTEADIDAGLVRPPPTMEEDLVSYDAVQADLKKSLNKASDTIKSIDIRTFVGAKTPPPVRRPDVNKQVSELFEEMKKSNDVVDASDLTRLVLQGQIYIDQDSNSTVKYLDQNAEDKIRKRQEVQQKNYLELISSLKKVKAPDGKDADTRLSRYQVNYPSETLTGGSRNQSAGADTLTDLRSENTSATETVASVQKRVGDLMEKMTSADLYSHIQDFEAIKQRMSLLNEMVALADAISASAASLSPPPPSINTSKLQLQMTKLFKDFSIKPPIWSDFGNIPDPALINAEKLSSPMFDTLSVLKALVYLIDKDNREWKSTDDMKIIVEIISTILPKQSGGSSLMSPVHLQYGGARELARLNRSLYAIRNTIRELTAEIRNRDITMQQTDLDQLKGLASDLISTNVITINTFAQQIVAAIGRFNVLTQYLQTVRKEIRKSRDRLDRFSVYVREKFVGLDDFRFENIRKIISLADTNMTTQYFDDFYRKYVTNYAGRIQQSVNNVPLTFSLRKEINQITSRRYLLGKTLMELNACNTILPNLGNFVGQINPDWDAILRTETDIEKYQTAPDRLKRAEDAYERAKRVLDGAKKEQIKAADLVEKAFFDNRSKKNALNTALRLYGKGHDIVNNARTEAKTSSNEYAAAQIRLSTAKNAVSVAEQREQYRSDSLDSAKRDAEGHEEKLDREELSMERYIKGIDIYITSCYYSLVNSWLPVFPELLDQLPITSLLGEILARWLYMQPLLMKDLINKYILNAKGKPKRDVISMDERIKLLKALADSYIKYQQLLAEAVTSLNKEAIDMRIHETRKHVNNINDVDGLEKLAKFLLEKSVDRWHSPTVRGKFVQAIEDHITRFSRDHNLSRWAVIEVLVGQLENLGVGIYDLYTNKLRGTYYLLGNFSLIDPETMSLFQKIQTDQNDLNTIIEELSKGDKNTAIGNISRYRGFQENARSYYRTINTRLKLKADDLSQSVITLTDITIPTIPDAYYSNVGSGNDIYMLTAAIPELDYEEIEPILTTLNQQTIALSTLLRSADKLIATIDTRRDQLKTIAQPANRRSKVDVGNYVNLLGKSILEIVRESNLSTDVKTNVSKALQVSVDKLSDEYGNILATGPKIANESAPPFAFSKAEYANKVPYDKLALYLTKNDIDWLQYVFLISVYKTIYEQLDELFVAQANDLHDKLEELGRPVAESIREIIDKSVNNSEMIKVAQPTSKLSNQITSTNTSTSKMKYLVMNHQTYIDNQAAVNKLGSSVKGILRIADPAVGKFFEAEKKTYADLDKLDVDIVTDINDMTQYITDSNRTLSEMLLNVSPMFAPRVSSHGFLNDSQVLSQFNDVLLTYQATWQIRDSKFADVIKQQNFHQYTLGQINSYQLFLIGINKRIAVKPPRRPPVYSPVVDKFYIRISFGLIQYYLDIMQNILRCLNSQKTATPHPIEAFFSKYYYIQLNRSYKLFNWIHNVYLKDKQAEDAEGKVSKDDIILKKKISPLKVTGDATIVFYEFQGLRRLLDEYAAIAMEKAQLHLRINDFVVDTYNKDVDSKCMTQFNFSELDCAILLDVDPADQKYLDRLKNKDLMFINANDKLEVNLDLLTKINKAENKDIDPQLHYEALYKKQKEEDGIQFQRIYDPISFPDSSVISNYMSIAPNIRNGKGTVIMTYGYSGVGKSASLFGRGSTPGILQVTMSQFENVEIYFRVFEIYGLGTQYNYYWNRENGRECYPKFYETVIQYVLTKSTGELTIEKKIVLGNRHDILSFVLNLENPASKTGYAVNSDNLKSDTAYFTSGRFNRSTYIPISTQDYQNFDGFVKKIDASRLDGVDITRIFTNTVKQVKSTVNNVESSRSILVYDFEINVGSPAKPVFVPFIIYDLPGKEDIYRTYIVPNEKTEGTGNIGKRVLRDIKEDLGYKERKTSYVMNPLLIPIFDDNYLLVAEVLTEVSAKMDQTIQGEIVQKILAHEVNNFGYDENSQFQSNRLNYPIKQFYRDSASGINTFAAMVDQSNFIVNKNSTVNEILKHIVAKSGLVSAFIVYEKSPKDLAKILETAIKNTLVQICVVTIGFLIDYQLFDVIVRMIWKITGSAVSDDDGGWTVSKIYSFFEAYYINENVIGLLQYLIRKVLGKNSSIQSQTAINESMKETIDANYKTATRYQAVETLLKTNTYRAQYDYGFYVNPTVLKEGTSELRDREIRQFRIDNKLDEYEGYAIVNRTASEEIMTRMQSVIAFENRGTYDSNRIFRNGDKDCSAPSDAKYIINPLYVIKSNQQETLLESNNPLLQDFLEPYAQKIDFYYIFYVITNGQALLKADEQVKLLNNSMPFINEIATGKKKQCVH